MDDNHELVETLLKGTTPVEREHLLEVIRDAYVNEPPSANPIGSKRPRFTVSKPALRHWA